MGATATATELRVTAAAKATNFRNAFKSYEGFKFFVETHHTALDQHGHPGTKQTWSNEDLDPTPPGKRTWRWWNFVTFYLGLSFGNWTLGSTMVGIGLNWWQSILVIFASQLISSIAMFFNSRCASVYHIGYPVVARSVFGMWGSYYFVGARAALAIIWYGVQRRPYRERILTAYLLIEPQYTPGPRSWQISCVAYSVTTIPIFQTIFQHL
jgi:NCS1 family nucleobase:cation symporter-1